MAVETNYDSTQENHRRGWKGLRTWLISPKKIRINIEIHEAYISDIEGQKGHHEVVLTIREVERKDEGYGLMEVR